MELYQPEHTHRLQCILHPRPLLHEVRLHWLRCKLRLPHSDTLKGFNVLLTLEILQFLTNLDIYSAKVHTDYADWSSTGFLAIFSSF